MVKEYQSLNPSNARIEIDYEKDDVKIEYVHNKSPFIICFETFLFPSIIANMLFIIIGLMVYTIIMGEQSSANFIFTNEILLVACYELIIGIWLIINPIIVALIFSKNEKLLKLMPEINYKLALRKPTIAEFNSQDIIDNKCEIPLFSNVGLDYDATEDFSKYLIKVKIVEHGFNNLIKGKKKKLNPYLWKAIFYFKEKPINGKLEVKFK